MLKNLRGFGPFRNLLKIIGISVRIGDKSIPIRLSFSLVKPFSTNLSLITLSVQKLNRNVAIKITKIRMGLMQRIFQIIL